MYCKSRVLIDYFGMFLDRFIKIATVVQQVAHPLSLALHCVMTKDVKYNMYRCYDRSTTIIATIGGMLWPKNKHATHYQVHAVRTSRHTQYNQRVHAFMIYFTPLLSRLQIIKLSQDQFLHRELLASENTCKICIFNLTGQN